MTDAFFQLHSDLDREGPGEPDDVLWALDTCHPPEFGRILDAGCGAGADTLELAKIFSFGDILAVDAHAPFVDNAKNRCADFGNVTCVTGDMYAQDGPFDMIYCAGAIYFQGVEAGLRAFRKCLTPTGRICFSDAIWLKNDPPKVLADFWADYPGMTDLDGLRRKVETAGFEILGQRILSENAWDNYYRPMQDRIDGLRSGPMDAGLAEVLEDGEVEIAMRRQFADHYGYAMLAVTPK